MNNKTRIKAILFDFGGVISKPQNKQAVDEICRILDLPYNTFLKTYRKFRPEYDSAAVSAEVYWQRVLNHHTIQPGGNIIPKLIELDVKSWLDIDEESLEYYLSLTGVKKAIVSNMPWETLKYMKKNLTWLNNFNPALFSCEINTSKPGIAIYKKCLQVLGLPPTDCLFTDDSMENIGGAKMAGLNTIHFKNLEQFKNELSETYEFD